MITNCRSCKSKRIVDVLSLGDQYLSEFVDSPDQKPEKYPLDLVLCQDCDLLQLKDNVSKDLLYSNNYGYYSGVNNTMREHLKGIVNKATSLVKLDMEDIVLDIGSNDATLLKNYPQEVIRVGFDLVEKFKKYYDQTNLVLVNHGFSADIFNVIFAGNIHKGKKAKIITAISMFYDLEDPNSFVEDLAKVLDKDGVLIIQQNYLLTMLQNNAFDNIVHEHLEYYSLTSLTRLLNRHYLDVVDVEVNDLNGGSFRVYVKHMGEIKKLRLLEQKMKLNNHVTYLMTGMKIKNIIKKLNKFIRDVRENGKKVYIYGASTRGNTLLQSAGLDNTLIKAAVERNPDKWGKYIGSTGIPIISEEQARDEKPDYMLVLPYFFKDEFIKREEEYIKSGGSLIFPLPQFEIVNNENINNYTISTS